MSGEYLKDRSAILNPLPRRKKRPMKSRIIETTINRDVIVSQVAAFLYAASIINDNEEITNIQFGELFGASTTEHVPIKIYLNQHTKVSIINH